MKYRAVPMSEAATENPADLRNLAFDNSIQPNIITLASTGKILMCNIAASKLLGYSQKEILTKRRTDIFDIKEDSFKKMLKERTADGKSIAHVTIITKKGKHISCEISSAIFKDENGIKKAITTVSDLRGAIQIQKNIDIKKAKKVAADIVLALAKSDARITENNEWIKYIAQASYDVMWDWDIASNQIYVGDSVEEVFGYRVEDSYISFQSFIDCLPLDKKRTIEKKILQTLSSNKKVWNDSFMLKRQDNTLSSTTSRASIIRDDKGNAVRLIGATQDISRLLYLEDELRTLNAFKKLETKKGKVAAGNIIQAKTKQKKLDVKNEKLVAQNILLAQIKSDAILAKSNEEHSTTANLAAERFQDEILMKEKRILEAIEDAKDTERSDIAKELHDNVNQLLGASRLYLEMAKKGGEKSEMYLSRSSEYTLMAIEEIRKLTKNLTTDIIKNLGLCEAIENICNDTMEMSTVIISFDLDKSIESVVDNKFKLNVYRIIQEQLNNILKHAHAKEVGINLFQKDKCIWLSITDDGIGFDTRKKRKGIGLANIKGRAADYNGSADLISEPGKGCTLKVIFPLQFEV